MAQSGQDPSYRWPPALEDILVAQSPPTSLTEATWLLDHFEYRRQLPQVGALQGISVSSSAAAAPAPAPAPPPPQTETKASNTEVIPGLARKHLGYLELCRLHNTGLTLAEGDVLVIIDYPAHPKVGPRYVDCHGTPYPSQEFRVHSSKLLATRSSKFTEILSPAYQRRARTRKRFANRTLPEGINYVLDLTPPSEGDDLAFQMTRLSLTPGIVDWWAKTSLEGDNAWMVDGHDDVCACKTPTPIAEAIQKMRDAEMEAKEKAEAEANAAETKADAGASAADAEPSSEISVEERTLDSASREAREEAQRLAPRIVPRYRNVPDYCPVRHRNSIVRLLMLIQGWDVMLDSGNRVWSLVAVANIWDCASVVRDRVAQWMMYDQNIKFIEALPEEALRISFDLQLVQVARCAYGILAIELAIEQAATPTANDAALPLPQQEPTRNTVFGRRKGSLDDELMNMIQHAARALVERMSQDLTTLPDLWTGDEWTTLKSMERALAQEVDEECVSTLEILRGFMKAITRPMDKPFLDALKAISTERTVIGKRLFLNADMDRAKYVAREDFKTLDQIMETLNPVQKLLCLFNSPEFATALHRIWRGSVFRTPDYRPQYKWYAREFDQAIRRLILRNPQKIASSSNWDVFFNGCCDPNTSPQTLASNLQPSMIDYVALDQEFSLALQSFSDSHSRSARDPLSGIAQYLQLELNDEEMRFLPLWAGGLDDGTGGVFEDPRPPAQLGPDGPGPAYHTGVTLPSAPSTSVPGSLLNGIARLIISESTVVGSVDAQGSIYEPRHVIPLGSGVSLASEPLTTGTSEFLDAALELPGPADWEVEPAMGDYPDGKSDSTITDFESMSMANEGASDGEDAEADGSIVVVNEQSDSEESVVLVSSFLPLS